MSNAKNVIAVGVVVTVAVAGFATVYIPYYSEEGKERREAYQRTGQVLRDQSVTRRPGSMYENMNKNANAKK